MALYFLLHDPALFEEHIRPALAASWRQRSFTPCRQLCGRLAEVVGAFAERYQVSPDDLLINQVPLGLAFDRDRWSLLVGEVLFCAAVEIPEIQTSPEALCCLLAPKTAGIERMRPDFAPIQQVHFGTHDLAFGGRYYRPDHAGFNGIDDVARLAAYLHGVDPNSWDAAALAPLPELPDADERGEELEFVREWFPAVATFYRRAAEQRQLIICEEL